MNLFNEILEKLSNKIQGNQLNKESITNEISEIVGVQIIPDQIKIINEKIIFNVSPTIKSSIRLKESKIIEVLKKYKITTIG